MAHKRWQANTLEVKCVTLQLPTSTSMLTKPCFVGRTVDQELQTLIVSSSSRSTVQKIYRFYNAECPASFNADNTAPDLRFQSRYVLNIYEYTVALLTNIKIHAVQAQQCKSCSCTCTYACNECTVERTVIQAAPLYLQSVAALLLTTHATHVRASRRHLTVKEEKPA